MSLNEKEKKELEMLDNPEIRSFSSPFNPLGSFLFGDNINNLKRRKERVAELRTRMRMSELKLDMNKDFQKYYEIKNEEEKRFDERFKDFERK